MIDRYFSQAVGFNNHFDLGFSFGNQPGQALDLAGKPGAAWFDGARNNEELSCPFEGCVLEESLRTGQKALQLLFQVDSPADPLLAGGGKRGISIEG